MTDWQLHKLHAIIHVAHVGHKLHLFSILKTPHTAAFVRGEKIY